MFNNTPRAVLSFSVFHISHLEKEKRIFWVSANQSQVVLPQGKVLPIMGFINLQDSELRSCHTFSSYTSLIPQNRIKGNRMNPSFSKEDQRKSNDSIFLRKGGKAGGKKFKTGAIHLSYTCDHQGKLSFMESLHYWMWKLPLWLYSKHVIQREGFKSWIPSDAGDCLFGLFFSNSYGRSVTGSLTQKSDNSVSQNLPYQKLFLPLSDPLDPVLFRRIFLFPFEE